MTKKKPVTQEMKDALEYVDRCRIQAIHIKSETKRAIVHAHQVGCTSVSIQRVMGKSRRWVYGILNS